MPADDLERLANDVSSRMAQLVARVDTLTPPHRACVFEGFEKPEVFQAIIPGASGEW